MKILTFNFCLGYRSQKLRYIQLFFETVAYNYDILLLEEVWDVIFSFRKRSYLKRLLDIAKKHGFYNVSYKKRSFYQSCNNGLVILSKIPIQYSDTITYSKSCTFLSFVPTGFQHIQVTIDYNKIDIFFTHIGATPFTPKKENTLDQIRQLIDYVSTIKPAHWVIAGNFNIDAIGESLDYNYLATMINRHSLLKTINFPNTYPVSSNGRRTCVDHIFSNISTYKIEVKEFATLSNHAAVSLSLFFPNRLLHKVL
jgi:endonuclease/exonuclease/phosphatase family metal-dependent hydrolase